MIEIRAHALYSRAALAELLRPIGIDVDFFISRLRPKKIFRAAWFGKDLLDALAEASALGGSGPESNPRSRKRRGARGISSGQGGGSARKRTTARLEASLEPLKALARESHEQPSAD